MLQSKPHYLLFTDCEDIASDDSSLSHENSDHAGGRWRFVIESIDGEESTDVGDYEPDVTGERLELLAVVRGLESLNEPARITLVTASRYVNRGLRFGLHEWKASGWKWERHGWMVDVKHADLWQRVDGAMKFHTVQCRQWRFDQAHTVGAPHSSGLAPSPLNCHSPSEVVGIKCRPRGQRLPKMAAARSVLQTLRNVVEAAGGTKSDKSTSSWSLAH